MLCNCEKLRPWTAEGGDAFPNFSPVVPLVNVSMLDTRSCVMFVDGARNTFSHSCVPPDARITSPVSRFSTCHPGWGVTATPPPISIEFPSGFGLGAGFGFGCDDGAGAGCVDGAGAGCVDGPGAGAVDEPGFGAGFVDG